MYVLELVGMDDEFAAFEAGCVATDVEILAPGLATARGLPDQASRLAFTHRASELLGTCDPTVEDATLLLEATGMERTGSAAVRAVDVRGTTGIDTQAVERELGSVLVDDGFDIDLGTPDHELRALFAEDICALGWLAMEPERTFTAREPGERPFFQPGSMDPKLARALANMAGARPGVRILDPMCGTGGILLEGGLLGARVVGTDVQQKMVAGTRENLATLRHSEFDVALADASTLPFEDGSFDGVVFDTPYGRQSKIRGELHHLVREALAEARRLASRCVVVGDRPWAQPAHAVGWQTTAAFDRRVHRSLTRYVVVLDSR